MPAPPENMPPNSAPQPVLLGADAFESSVPGRTMPRGEKRERDEGSELASKRAKTGEPAPKPADESINDDPARLEGQRQVLHALFLQDGPPMLPADVDADLSIDDERHTALHWAAGLGRADIARVLVARGATPGRGNHVGETALMRAVVTTNSYELDVFPALLALLASSLPLADDHGRTVLHHAVGVAGIRGRAASAKYYVECVLASGADLGDLVDHADAAGNTALSVAARVGNTGLARILLDHGADPTKPNKVGLRPCDFGLEGVVRAVACQDEPTHIPQSAPPPAPETMTLPPLKSSADVLAQLGKLLTSLDNDHAAEVGRKSESVVKARANLRQAAQQLALARSRLTEASARTGDVAAARQRIANYERALREEDGFDWTGRTELDGAPARAGAAFAFLGPESTLAVNMPPLKDLPPMDVDAPLPPTPTQLRRLVGWYGRAIGLLRQRIARADATPADLEAAYRKLVARSCRVPVDRVDAMLDQLVLAMETDANAIDTSRMAAVLSKARS